MQIFDHELASLRQLHDMPYNLPYIVPGHQGRMYDPTITRDRFDWIEIHYGALSAPWFQGCFEPDLLEILVLFAFMSKVPRLPVAREWFALHHQAGGGACEQYHFVGTRLTPRSLLYPALRQIARDRYPGGRAGWDGQHFCAAELRENDKAMQDYRAEVARLNLTYSETWLTESIYPLDATQQNLERLTGEKVELSDFGVDSRFEAEDTGARILIISSNSD